MKFLVIDDSSTMRRIVTNSLQRCGYTSFVEATDGADALKKFDETIDFVVSDWNMPTMSGLEFARALRARPEAARVPLLMITTRATKEDILTAAQAGVTGYILKPFTPDVFKEKITALVTALQGVEGAA